MDRGGQAVRIEKRGDMDMSDRIVSPDLSNPSVVQRGPRVVFLQRIRDDSNTAVTYQKKQREKHYTRSDLDDVLRWVPNKESIACSFWF